MTDAPTYEPTDPEPMTWAGVEMWRCPLERCGFSHEERDEVVEHIQLLGHIGPDPELPDEPEVIPTESDTAAAAAYNNEGEGGKS